MSYSAQYTNLEAGPLTPVIDPAAINPGNPPPTYFAPQQWTGGMTNVLAGPAGSAGLTKFEVTLPPNFSQFILSYDINPDFSATTLSLVHETDLIIVGIDGSWYNGSCQKNNAQGGMWQIPDASGNWQTTGFKPGLFPSGTWTSVKVKYTVNWTAKTISTVSIQDGATVFPILSAMQTTPAKQGMGWQPGILVGQIQDCLKLAGTYSRSMRNVGIGMS
jgi:hypothetical protein